jgi:hypothetical protein
MSSPIVMPSLPSWLPNPKRGEGTEGLHVAIQEMVFNLTETVKVDVKALRTALVASRSAYGNSPLPPGSNGTLQVDVEIANMEQHLHDRMEMGVDVIADMARVQGQEAGAWHALATMMIWACSLLAVLCVGGCVLYVLRRACRPAPVPTQGQDLPAPQPHVPVLWQVGSGGNSEEEIPMEQVDSLDEEEVIEVVIQGYPEEPPCLDEGMFHLELVAGPV